MHILYVSNLCSDEKFKEIFNNSSIKPQQQAQKFHSLLSKGLINQVESVYVMSSLPINRSTDNNVSLSGCKEIKNSTTYHYLKGIKYPVLKHLSIFIRGISNSFIWCFQNRKRDRLVICDVLNLTVSISAFLASKIFGVRSIAIVTDIPDYMQNYTLLKKNGIRSLFSNLYKRLCNYFMYRYDSYIILTEQMNNVVNPNRKPFVVIEGMVDLDMKDVPNILDNKYSEKIVIYAGALYEKYGVKKLIEAFLKLKMDDARLWLFGSGEMEDEIRSYEQLDNRVRYFGVVPNEDIVKKQLKATLLVNPRPSNEEFTKYSFPSKNMEYMVSGTPILTTPLQGMPKEYYDYVYLIEDESVEGLTQTLIDILSKPKEELHEKGLKTKEFVLEVKNNVVQATKVLKKLS
ncbi:glycosyltransferase [Peribacillus sp. R9-11]|uniref:glycosyltransferase n=1 Tax=Peribacillus sp. R9-11 TaxID=3073271 RepID=UPI002869174E|nr:glycosyltransferase [Peribacillus sp. R9-11]WMX54276.1 glycosyltransferase [Peribacillus sp. R9-11]